MPSPTRPKPKRAKKDKPKPVKPFRCYVIADENGNARAMRLVRYSADDHVRQWYTACHVVVGKFSPLTKRARQ